MGKSSKKVTKKVVGAANDIAREVRARQAAEIDALPAAGGGELSAADAEGSAGESTVPGRWRPAAWLATMGSRVMRRLVRRRGQ